MEKLLKMVFTTENVRTAIILVAMTCGFVWLRGDMQEKMRTQIDAVHQDLTAKIDSFREELRTEIAELREEMNEMSAKIEALQKEVFTIKTNDIAHLHAAIEALTFTLMKNGTLTPSDKDYIDTRLKSKP